MKALLQQKNRVKPIIFTLVFIITMAALPLFANASTKLRVVGVQASSTLGGNMGPANLINGSKDDMYSSQSDAGCWIYLELDDYYDVESVNLIGRSDAYMFPNAVQFSYSLDGIGWTLVENGDFTFESKDQTHTKEVENPCVFQKPVTTKFIRVQTTSSKFDGTSYLTQYAEIEIYGGEADNRPDVDLQSYKLERIGNADNNFYQFEDVANTPSYPDDSYFIPYYRNPVFGDGDTRMPAAAFYGGKYVVAYEKGTAGKTEIYAKVSQTDMPDSFYDAEYKLVAKGSFDGVGSPSFVTVGSKTYLAVEVTTGSNTKIAMVEYTGQKNITLSNSDILDFSVSAAGYNGDMACPSLTYDKNTDTLRLYFAIESGGFYSMHMAETKADAPKSFAYKQGIDYFNYGKVFYSAGGYFGIVKSYFDNSGSLSEWISSADGLSFERQGALAKGNILPNGLELSTGNGCAAIGADGHIAAVFVETCGMDEKTGIMMALPQMRVSLSNGYVTLPRVMAINRTTQIVLADRDYTSTDLVRIYRSPSETTVYELRQNVTAGNSYQVLPINSIVPARDTAQAIVNPSLDGLTWVMPERVTGNSAFPIYSVENLIAYDESIQWQTAAVYTYNTPEEELVITLPASMSIGAFSMSGAPGNGTPNAFRVFVSQDNRTYTQVKNQTQYDYPGIDTTAERVFRFDEPVTGKYLKIVFDRYSPNISNMCQVSLSKLKIYAQNPDSKYVYDPATLVRGQEETLEYNGKTLEKADIVSVAASSELNDTTWKAANLTDGDKETNWSGASDQSGTKKEFVTFDLGTKTNVARVELVPRGDAVCFPKGFSLSYSNDGENWTEIPGQTYSNYPVPDTQLHQYLTFSAPVQARYIRLNIDKQRSDGNNFMTHLSEVEICKVAG